MERCIQETGWERHPVTGKWRKRRCNYTDSYPSRLIYRCEGLEVHGIEYYCEQHWPGPVKLDVEFGSVFTTDQPSGAAVTHSKATGGGTDART